MNVTNREARMWDQARQMGTLRQVKEDRMAAVHGSLQQRSSKTASPNTPEGASGCSQAVVSHEGRAVAARGSRPQVNAGMNSARATVSTTAAAPAENPGTSSATPLTGAGAGARLQQAKQIIGQRSLL